MSEPSAEQTPDGRLVANFDGTTWVWRTGRL